MSNQPWAWRSSWVLSSPALLHPSRPQYQAFSDAIAFYVGIATDENRVLVLESCVSQED